jgi:LacI family transcriptional regulator
MDTSRPKQQGRATLQDIAREAGVHISTAAAILNGGGGNSRASEETRQRIIEVAQRLEYRPNRMAQNLRRRRSMRIGLVAGTVNNPFFANMAILVERHLIEYGYEFVMSMDAGLYRDDITLLETLLSRSVDGIIYWSERESGGRRVVEKGVDCPVVIFGYPSEVVDSVTVDFGLGARLAVEHLAEEGFQRIAYFCPSESATLWSGKWREGGYRAEMEERGLEPVVHCYEGSLGDLAKTTEAAEALGRSADCPDALFCFNDLVAFGAMMGLRRAGKNIPEDVALVGFDDIPLARELDVPLTTLDMPMSDVCRTAVDLVMDRLRRKSGDEVRSVQLLPHLIVRSSSRKSRDNSLHSTRTKRAEP